MWQPGLSSGNASISSTTFKSVCLVDSLFPVIINIFQPSSSAGVDKYTNQLLRDSATEVISHSLLHGHLLKYFRIFKYVFRCFSRRFVGGVHHNVQTQWSFLGDIRGLGLFLRDFRRPDHSWAVASETFIVGLKLSSAIPVFIGPKVSSTVCADLMCLFGCHLLDRRCSRGRYPFTGKRPALPLAPVF